MLGIVLSLYATLSPIRCGTHVSFSRSVSFSRAIADPPLALGLHSRRALDVAATNVRKAAASFGPLQRDAADKWVQQTINMGGFSAAALLEHKDRLFDECTIDDDGSPESVALVNSLVDLQEAIFRSSTGYASTSRHITTQAKVNKAALAVRSTAAQFGEAQEKQADKWVVRALSGERTHSLLEESYALLHECERSEEGARAASKCDELGRALEELRVALGDVRGNAVSVTKMTDMEYKFHRRLHDAPGPRRRRWGLARKIWGLAC